MLQSLLCDLLQAQVEELVVAKAFRIPSCCTLLIFTLFLLNDHLDLVIVAQRLLDSLGARAGVPQVAPPLRVLRRDAVVFNVLFLDL